MKRGLTIQIGLLIAFILLMTGCFDTGGGILNFGKKDKYNPKKPVTLKVLIPGSVSTDPRNLINKENVNLASKEFPNITVRFFDRMEIWDRVSTEEEYWKEVKQLDPDIMMIGEREFLALVADNKLRDLAPFIERDQFDLSAFHSSVIEKLRLMGDDKLYGLSPQLYGDALYYNKSLFDEYGVDYPVEDMSWEQLFERAARFAPHSTKDRPLYGFLLSEYETNPFSLVRQIAFAKGQIPVNPEMTEVEIRSDEWRQAFELVVNGMQGGYVSRPPEEREMQVITKPSDEFIYDLFISGFAAMRIENTKYLKTIERAERLGFISADWQLAPIPIEPSYPDATQGFGLGQIMVIFKDSENANAAWEWIKFFNGNTIAERISDQWEIPSRLSYIQNNARYDISAFVKYGGDPKLTIFEYVRKMPGRFWNTFNYDIGKEEMNKLLDGFQSLDETILEIERKGQLAFDEAKAAEGGDSD